MQVAGGVRGKCLVCVCVFVVVVALVCVEMKVQGVQGPPVVV